jgi:hypothetical protein
MTNPIRHLVTAPILLVVIGCGPSHEAYLAQVTQLGGAAAVNCGYVPIRQDPASSLACMEEQLALEKPFRVSVETYGLESIVTFTVVRDGAGVQQYLLYDPDTCNHNCWFKRPRIWRGECPDPHVARNPDGSFARDPIECIRSAA